MEMVIIDKNSLLMEYLTQYYLHSIMHTVECYILEELNFPVFHELRKICQTFALETNLHLADL